jgi:phosphohistidine phosphatase
MTTNSGEPTQPQAASLESHQLPEGGRILVIVRHAKSSWEEPALSDFDRPLDSRGRADAPGMANRLAGHLLAYAPGLRPMVHASPARRAAQTAEALLGPLGQSTEAVHWHQEIYEAGWRTLFELCRELDAETKLAILVGHNPGLSDLAHHLLESAFRAELPTAALVGLRVPGTWAELTPHTGELLFFDTPKGSD